MASLADVELEREKIRATRAKRRFDAAYAATCSKAELLAAAASVRRVMLAAIDAAGPRLLGAIDGLHDEASINQAMTETVHQILTEIGDAAVAASGALPLVGESVKRGIKPREPLTVSQWADRHRWMETGTNSRGQWHTSLTPYLREIMDSLSEHAAVSEVVFVKSVQVGATEVMNNFLGYLIDHIGNQDALVVVPTKEFRNQKFNPRFGRMLRETPRLKKLVSLSSRDKKNTEEIVEFSGGGKIIKAGANVSTDLRSDPVAFVVCDEVDEFPAEIPGSGDPMNLIEGRQTTFSREKIFKISSPKTEDTSRIWSAWLKTDQRHYHVACPHCDEFQHLEWGAPEIPYGLKWTLAPRMPNDTNADRAAHVYYVCKHCGAEFDEGHKTEMLAGGRWIADAPHVKGRRGYHINALYAPVGLGRNWRWLVNKWLACLGNSAEMQTFKNERLGLPWKEEYEAADPLAIMKRMEVYATRPAGLVRSVGIDVQKDVIELTVYEYGPDEEAWAICHYLVPGQTITQEPWDELGELLAEIKPDCGGLDSGYNAEMAYQFARRRPWLFVMKGVKALSLDTLIEDDGKRRQRLRHKRKTGQSPFLVSNTIGMREITERLNIPLPEAGKPRGKFIHFPAGVKEFDLGFFEQLTANKKTFKKIRHRIIVEWRENTPNEAYDCWKYALAAFRLSKLDPASRAAKATDAAPASVASAMLASLKARR